tara:strand:- start:3662 stop:4639 length:978 start_codon:yes stop_codon:yes gene_type:complete
MTLEEIESIIESEYGYLRSEYDNWSLTTSDQHDLKLVAHVLRVLIHKKVVETSTPEFIALGAQQNEDGGWGETGADNESKVWVSAFCGLMLIRGNHILGYERLSGSIQIALRYFLDSQQSDGRWVDPCWSTLDATSQSVSFLNVVLVLGKEFGKKMREKVMESWKKGMRFILDNQAMDGGWYDQEFHATGIAITARLIKDALVADTMIENVMRVSRPCRKGAEFLLALQEESGSWGNDNVDHTMDCTRSLMLVSRMLGIEHQCDSAIQSSVAWVVKNKNEQGWPDFPGMDTNLERTCNGLDTMMKFLAYSEEDPTKIMRYWGYLN